MNTHDIDIELPAEFRSGNDIPVTQATIKRERMEEILRDAIEADRKQRSFTKPSTNQDWLSLDPAVAFHLIERHAENWNDAGAMMQAYLDAHIEADRKTYNSIGEGTIQQLHDVLLYLQNETMKLEAAYGSNFKKEATEKARAATEKMKEAVYAIKNIDRKRRGEPVAWRYLTPTGWHATTDAARALGVAEHHTVEQLFAAPQPADPTVKESLSVAEPVAWLYEDELPDNYPYEAMFPYSKVDGVRMFPVYAPQPAEPVKVNAIFETQDGVVTGTTDAKVRRVEWQDDGSLTVVIDYWPQPAGLASA